MRLSRTALCAICCLLFGGAIAEAQNSTASRAKAVPTDAPQRPSSHSGPTEDQAASAATSLLRSVPVTALPSAADSSIATDQFANARRAAAERATPQSQEERQRSRTRYRDLSAADALAAARDEHRAWLTEPAWIPPQLRAGERAVGHRGERGLLIARAGEDAPAIAVASSPLVTSDHSGKQAPIDLTLRESGGAFAPLNARVDTRLPDRLTDGVEFPADELTLSFDAAPGSQARRVDDKLFYDNFAHDSDLIMEALPAGFAAYYQLRSPASPEHFTMTPGQSGGTFTLTGSGAELHQDGLRVIDITAPVAFDAQGQPVSARFKADGANLVVEVAHRDRDVAYPVLVDPQIIRVEQELHDYTGWQFSTSWPGKFSGNWCPWCEPDSGLWLQSTAGQAFTNGSYGWWTMPTPNYTGGTAYTFRTDWHDTRHRPPVYACITEGLFIPSLGDWERNGYSKDPTNNVGAPGPFINCPGMSAGSPTTCARTADCHWDAMPGTHPAFQQWMLGNGTRSGSDLAWVRNPIVFMRDYDDPTVSRTHWDAAAGLNGWSRFAVGYGQMRAEDRGLGIYYLEPVVSDGLDVSVDYGGDPRDCSGDWAARCAFSWVANFAVEPRWEGVHSVSLQAIDVIERSAAPVEFQYKYDATSPDIRASGRLAELDGRSMTGDARLELHVFDGSPDHPRSGVRSVQFEVDLKPVQSTGDQACPQGSCDIKTSYLLRSADLEPGEHRIDAVACDWAGNCTRQTWDVTIAAGDLPSVQEGASTGRWLPLRAVRTRGDATAVTFEYRRGSSDPWREIPIDAVRTRRGESLTGGWPVALDELGTSAELVWDLTATHGLRDANGRIPDGVVEMRGKFDNSTLTADFHPTFVASGVGTDDDTADLGPLSVDLFTGNGGLEATDVEVDAYKADLIVTRTYNSRAEDVAGAFQPLGPGWTLGVRPDSGGLRFASVRNMAEVGGDDGGFYAVARTAAGDEVAFEESSDGTRYIPELGFEELRLERHMENGRIARYTLVDNSTGDTMTFFPGATPGEYALEQIKQVSGAESVSIAYRPVPGAQNQQRVDRMLAPAPPGVDCSTLVRGCRALDFDYYTQTTTTGEYAGRLKRIRLRAWDPQLSVMVDIPLVEYQYDPNGRLSLVRDLREVGAGQENYEYTAGLLTSVTPAGELPWRISYQRGANDFDGGRVDQVSRATLPPATGTATQTIRYDVPLSGAGAPYDMRAEVLDQLGQKDVPLGATAVFRAEAASASEPDYARATIHYLNAQGMSVNVALPGARIATTEYDDRGDVVRDLTPANRQRALAESTPEQRAQTAAELSTQRTYEVTTAGSRLKEELGPRHLVRTAAGEEVMGRSRTTIIYDEDRPDSKDYNLPTTTTIGLKLDSEPMIDIRTTRATYDFARLLQTSVTAAGETTTTVHDANGLEIERRPPKDAPGTAAATRTTVRYTAGPNPVAQCGNRPEWAGLACLERPADQPASGPDRYPILTTEFEYDAFENITLERETGASGTRSTRIAYDRAGREKRQTVAATHGEPVPEITWSYDPLTGALKTMTGTLGGQTSTIQHEYDALGREIAYTDAHHAVTRTEYDILDRPVVISNAAGVQRFEYLPGLDAVATLKDSDLGDVHAQYDADGNLTSQQLSTSGLTVNTTYDETGDAVKRQYVKQSGCSTDCAWYSSEAVSSVHGQWLRHSDASATRLYKYDGSGRLVEADERTSASSCIRRYYEYDANSNRVTSGMHLPGAACGASTRDKIKTHAYDGADRIVDEGYVYDPFGRITRVPARDAGETPLDLEYFGNDLVRRMAQDGKAHTFTIDPSLRNATRQADGGPIELLHYADATDEPSWTDHGPDGTTREIPDIADDLVAVRRDQDVAIQVANLHGDVVAEVDNDPAAARPPSFSTADEFGVPAPPPGGPEPAPIEQVGAAVAMLTAPGMTLSIATPQGVHEGDLLLAEVAADEADLEAPDGWNDVPESEIDGQPSRYRVFWRIARADEPVSHDIAFAGPGRHRGGIKALRNADTEDPIDQVATKLESNYDAIDAPVVTPAVENTAISRFLGVDRWTPDIQNGDIEWGGPVEDWDTWDSFPLHADRAAASSTEILDGGQGAPTNAYRTGAAWGAGYSTHVGITTSINPASSSAQAGGARYAWLGTHQRSSYLASGAVTMGARVYLPQIGRFLQPDPVVGGSANAYDYVNQDPINQQDLDGRCPWCPIVAVGLLAAGRQLVKSGAKGARTAGRAAKSAGRKALRVSPATARAMVSIVKAAFQTAGKAAYKFASSPRGRKLFAPGSSLNSGRLRIGIGTHNKRWNFRIAWGNPKNKFLKGHIDLFKGEKKKRRPKW